MSVLALGSTDWVYFTWKYVTTNFSKLPNSIKKYNYKIICIYIKIICILLTSRIKVEKILDIHTNSIIGVALGLPVIFSWWIYFFNILHSSDTNWALLSFVLLATRPTQYYFNLFITSTISATFVRLLTYIFRFQPLLILLSMPNFNPIFQVALLSLGHHSNISFWDFSNHLSHSLQFHFTLSTLSITLPYFSPIFFLVIPSLQHLILLYINSFM